MFLNDSVRVLCVDDEPNVLAGISLHLRKRVTLETATGGEEALVMMRERGPFAIVVSDMRMPRMDGATLLAKIREGWPDTVRMLLTGYADVQAAADAVNRGQVFRFLAKPCTPTDLLSALSAAAEQHRLLTAERVLLEETLRGSVKALTDVLALANPMAFGRATRLRRRALDLAAQLQVPDAWKIEMATLLSQIGTVTLAPTVVDKLFYGFELDASERDQVARLPLIAEQILSQIPRLEEIRTIIRHQSDRFDGWSSGLSGAAIPIGARILKVATDLDELEAAPQAHPHPIATLRSRTGWYDPGVLRAAEALFARAAPIREVKPNELRAGMRLAADLRTVTGILLVPRDAEVDATIIERIANFATGLEGQLIRVYIEVEEPAAAEESAAA